MDLDNIQRKYGLPAPLPVVQNGKFATRFPLNLEHRGDDVFQFGGKYIGEIENIYDLLYKILTNQEIDASLALPYAIKITEDKLYVRDKTNSEWILIFDITKPNFPKEIELYELIYKAITHQVIGEDTFYPGQFKIEENILYVRDKDNLTWTQIGDVTKEFLGATEATQAILEQVNDILTEVQELKTELNRQIATTNETLTTALQAANEAMISVQSINIRTFNNVEEMKASNILKIGALVKTHGFYTTGDGGESDYVIIDSIDERKVDEATLITLKNGLYARLLVQDCVNVKQFGAKGDGVSDDTEALQKAFDFVKNYSIRMKTGYEDVNSEGVVSISIIIPKGFYYITSTLTAYIIGSIKANDAMIVASKEVTPAIIIEGVEATGDVGVYSLCNTWKIEGLKVSCNNVFNLEEKTIGIKFSENLKTDKWMTNFTNMFIRGFYYGVELGNNTYNNVFINCMFKNCIRCFHIPAQLTAAYERNTFISCTFADSTSAFECHRPDGMCSLFGCSLDYCIGETIIADNGSQFLLSGCWIEWNSKTNKNYQVKITTGENNRDSLVIISNSYILCQNNEELTSAPFYCDVKKSSHINAGLILENTRIAGIKADYLVDGGGQVSIKNITGYSQQNPRPDKTQDDVYTLSTVPFIPYGLRTDLSSYYKVDLNKEEGVLSIQKTNASVPAENMPYFIVPIKSSETIRFTAKLKGSSSLSGQRLLMDVGYGYIDATGKLISIFRQGTKDFTTTINQSVTNGDYVYDSDELGYNECRFTEMCPYPLVAYFIFKLGELNINYTVYFKELEILHLYG